MAVLAPSSTENQPGKSQKFQHTTSPFSDDLAKSKKMGLILTQINPNRVFRDKLKFLTNFKVTGYEKF